MFARALIVHDEDLQCRTLDALATRRPWIARWFSCRKKRGDKSLYWPKGSDVSFQWAASVGAVGTHAENPHDHDNSTVTLPMFLMNALDLWVPWSTAGSQQFQGLNNASRREQPFYPIQRKGPLRPLFQAHSLQQNGEDEEEPTADLLGIATTITELDSVYAPADIERIAVYLGIIAPTANDQSQESREIPIKFSDLLVLIVCLAFDPDPAAGPNSAPDPELMPSPANLVDQYFSNHHSRREAQRIRSFCLHCEYAYRQAQEKAGGSDVTGIDIALHALFESTLSPWIGLVNLDEIYEDSAENEAWQRLDDAQESDNDTDETKKRNKLLRKVVAYLRMIKGDVGLPDVVDVAMQMATHMQLTSHNIHVNIDSVQSARAYFEAVSNGTACGFADANRLLDLAYFGNPLSSDERRRALTQLNELSGIGQVAPDRDGESAEQIDFIAWVQFTLKNRIPTLNTATRPLQVINLGQTMGQVQHQRSQMITERLKHSSRAGAVNRDGVWGSVLLNMIGRPDKLKEICKQEDAGRSVVLLIAWVWVFGIIVGPQWLFLSRSWSSTHALPLYVASMPMVFSLIASYVYTTREEVQKQYEESEADAAAKGRLAVFLLTTGSTDEGKLLTLEADAQDIEEHIRVQGRVRKETTMGLLLHVELISVFVNLAVPYFYLFDSSGIVTPEYADAENHTFTALQVWGIAVNYLVSLYTLALGMWFMADVQNLLEAMNRSISHPVSPIVSFRHPKNVVAWCRMRDREMLRFRKQAQNIMTGTRLSIMWTIAALVYLGAMYMDNADKTPFVLTLVWFALMGTLNAVAILTFLTRANHAVTLQMYLLEQQLEMVHHEAVLLKSDQDPMETQLRLAAEAIRTDLHPYRDGAKNRFFFIFDIPVDKVLRVMATVLASQVAGFLAKNAQSLRENPVAYDGSGSFAGAGQSRFFSSEHE